MRGCVDEVGKAGQGCGKTDCWAIKSHDEDFWVGIEGLGNVEVVRDEAGEEVTVLVSSIRDVTAEGDICSTVTALAMSFSCSRLIR